MSKQDQRTLAKESRSADAVCSPACPVCEAAARWRTRTTKDHDGPGSITYAHLACVSCGIRSREVISLQPRRQVLADEWQGNKVLKGGQEDEVSGVVCGLGTVQGRIVEYLS